MAACPSMPDAVRVMYLPRRLRKCARGCAIPSGSACRMASNAVRTVSVSTIGVCAICAVGAGTRSIAISIAIAPRLDNLLKADPVTPGNFLRVTASLRQTGRDVISLRGPNFAAGRVFYELQPGNQAVNATFPANSSLDLVNAFGQFDQVGCINGPDADKSKAAQKFLGDIKPFAGRCTGKR